MEMKEVGTELAIRRDQRRVLLMLLEIAAENNGPVVARHIKAIKTEMMAEDVAYVEKMFHEG